MIVPLPELSRPLRVDAISSRGLVVDIEANAQERSALAERFGLLSLDRLVAQLRLMPSAGGVIRLSGHIEADVTQACVVSLVAVPAHVSEGFSMCFGAADEEDGDIEIAFEAEGPPDPIEGGIIDVGEAVAEHLALALDPFPRAPGAEFTPLVGDDDDAPVPAKVNPFAVLAGIGQKKG